jgi:hypothetical protein
VRPGLKRFLYAVIALGIILWGVQFSLRAAPGAPTALPEMPDVLGAYGDDAPVTTATEWIERRAPILRGAFSRLVYGAQPKTVAPIVSAVRVIDEKAWKGVARIEEWTLDVPLAHDPVQFHALVVLPRGAKGPLPVVIATNFCGNRAALAGRYKQVDPPAWTPARCRTPIQQWAAETLHGADIIAPPFAMLAKAGYAVVTFFPGEIVEDDPRLSQATLAALSRDMDESEPKAGALAAWAWGYSRALDVAAADPRFDATRIALWGHSRFGKAALVATAFDERVAAVIANQSGTFGATLSKTTRGESIAEITRKFPYWFSPSLSGAPAPTQDLPIDQHLLIALIAPRPILLGGARMDRWSDPGNAFAAAEAANPVYALFDKDGLAQATPSRTDISSDIVVFMRPGGHGIRPRDWRETVAFLDQHFRIR